MASVLDSVPAFAGLRSSSNSSNSSNSSLHALRCDGASGLSWRRRGGACRAMVQQAVQGASANYAKEMERLSAKESLLLAFKDSGGLESLVTGKTTDLQRIDVNERITCLERLNPAARPATSPFLEGRWNYEWFGISSPVFFLARFISERFPSALASLLGMDVIIKDAYAKATANMKLFNLIETKFILSAKLSVEGPLRMKEEYVEGLFEAPTVSEAAVPDQLKGPYLQAVNTVQQLPVPIRDVIANGLRIPLSGIFQRLYMISYLDEEILILRDANGAPEVLTRLDDVPARAGVEPFTEYES
ncbi:hypothetical protein Syun_017814 [Stephania yunnanensis]|uniref:Plastid lipid-associated protein/fibrillin conserved domain-containing protein n=1 Tax=Stephania yunnanensis TaxID=152371 RepID=A0AAP0JA00_9MAGN